MTIRGIITTVTLLAGVEAAVADCTGARVELIDDSDGLATYRVYVDFDDAHDVLLAVGGIPERAPLVFHATSEVHNDAGPLEGTKQGDFPGVGDARDSWVTLGGSTFPAEVDSSPGCGGVPTPQQMLRGASLVERDGGWFDPDPGTAVTGTPIERGDEQRWSVLIAQITLPKGAEFTLSGLANWKPRGRKTGAAGFVSSDFSVTSRDAEVVKPKRRLSPDDVS